MRTIKLKNAKRSAIPSMEDPLVASVIIADIQDDVDDANPIQDATVRNESINTGQSIFQPYVDIQHTWRCGQIDVLYGFSVSGAGVLIIDNTISGTGRLVV